MSADSLHGGNNLPPDPSAALLSPADRITAKIESAQDALRRAFDNCPPTLGDEEKAHYIIAQLARAAAWIADARLMMIWLPIMKPAAVPPSMAPSHVPTKADFDAQLIAAVRKGGAP